MPDICGMPMVPGRNAMEVAITLNGEIHRVAPGETLASLLARLGLDPEAVAVEVNRSIAPRSALASIPLNAGDEVEIVQFVGGG
jgi:thiamine biosynthesis protein ThiS